ncbi:U-box domain-containing protein 33-like [Carex rostrata]
MEKEGHLLTYLNDFLEKNMHHIERLEKTQDESYCLSESHYFTENYSALQDATNNFHDSFKLGEGATSIVYKGILHNTKTVAIKILKEGISLGAKEFNQEVKILSKVCHPNLVNLVGACVESRAFIYEYLPNGSLEDRLQCKDNTSPLSWQARVRIAFEICSALSFLHSRKPHVIVHGDLKPDNILLDSNNTSKICDSGLCRELNFTASASIPYHAYMDPEYLPTGKTTPQYDVYSFVIILLRLVTCKDPQGLRNLVEEAQKKGTLKAFIDASAGPWPFREAEKMISLGLRCSDLIKKNRPDLSTEVFKELKSMVEVANCCSEYSYSELQNATNNFDESFKLGEGGFGIVYKGILNNTPCAIKMLKEGSRHGTEDFNQEIEILSKVQHPNLVKFIGACAESCALIYEYLPNGSLEDRLRCKNNTLPLSWQARVRIAFEICSALSFLHCSEPHGIVHGDLKPDNILLDENDTSKICDFGLCRELDFTASASIPYHWTDCPRGTLAYMDLEYISIGKITPQYDAYSFGILLLRLVTCKNPQGLRPLVEEAQKKGTLKTLIDASAGPWPFKEAKKMISLGLRCSDPIRKNRPDLSTKVLKEIKSMLEVASAPASSWTASLFPRYFVTNS